MIARVLERAREVLEHIFPERQIYHRSNGEVRYLSLSTRIQIIASGAAIIAVLWFGYATASVFLSGHLLSSQSRQAFASRMHFQRLVAEARAKEASTQALLDNRTTAFTTAANDIERRLDTLKLLLDQTDNSALDTLLPGPNGVSKLVMNAASEDQTPRQSRTLTEVKQVDLKSIKDPIERLAWLHDKESRILRTAEERAEARIEGMQAVLSMTGLSLDDIISQDNSKIGGPLIALNESQLFGEALSLDKNFTRRVARLTGRVAKAEQLEDMLRDVPLREPLLVEHRKTSGFGTRIDPITHRAAHHSGQDFGAFRLAPITATADGTVTYAGWRTGYGRLVEIDHGFGFKTRYAHMAKIKVKRGQKVTFGQQVGSMGTSGRSTGVHLHYEVWFKGKPYDPQKFLKAGIYVQQG
ncbi:MAG: peptidase M23 [Robiginitomaculum sp.]|nr:MAG: peptidase M23 [Robiginitomaculum sp.]